MYHRTDRLLLRPLWPEDAFALAQLVAAWDRMDAEAYLQRSGLAFGVEAHGLAGSPLVGVVRLDRTQEALPYELAYWIGTCFSGQGLATEAARAAVEVAFLGLNQTHVTASCTPNNIASHRVLKKLGFQPTQVSRFSLSRAAWLNARGLLDWPRAA